MHFLNIFNRAESRHNDLCPRASPNLRVIDSRTVVASICGPLLEEGSYANGGRSFPLTKAASMHGGAFKYKEKNFKEYVIY
jgi:hypothetical protein